MKGECCPTGERLLPWSLSNEMGKSSAAGASGCLSKRKIKSKNTSLLELRVIYLALKFPDLRNSVRYINKAT